MTVILVKTEHLRVFQTTLMAAVLVCLPTHVAPAAPPAGGLSEEEHFFETKIRPLLVENCFKCHGTEKQKGGLRLDSTRTALEGGEIEISGELGHGSEIGDGIRATIYRNQEVRLGQWSAHNSNADTGIQSLSVDKGDTIDFVVDCIGDGSYDSYHWNPLIVPTKATPSLPGRTAWSPKRDFPRLPIEKPDTGKKPADTPKSFGPMEQFAQVLLMSNEFVNLE